MGKKTLTTTLCLLLLTSTAHAYTYSSSDTFCASGFGDTNGNGTYTYSANTWFGHISFGNSNGYYLSSENNTDSGYGVMLPTSGSVDQDYIAATGGITGTWATDGGSAPAGTVVFNTCEEEGGESTSSTTIASTTLQSVGAISMGFAILIAIGSTYLTAYLWNNLFKKKPWQAS